jgi:hypothetical protein
MFLDYPVSPQGFYERGEVTAAAREAAFIF